MTATIAPIGPEHLPQVQALVNAHTSTVVPGWGYPADFIARRLRANPDEYVTDPWVSERETFCAIGRGRVMAVAHLLRYGSGPEVGPDYEGVGEIDWFVAWPGQAEAAAQLLAAVRAQMQTWHVRTVHACNGWPGPLLGGVPETWPHIAEALTRAGYAPDLVGIEEALYGGRLPDEPVASESPIPGITLRRSMGEFGTKFAAWAADEIIGECECLADLTQGGELPALSGWAELGQMWVTSAWRNRGIGAWLVRHAVSWLRLAGCDRIILAVAAEDEAHGAGRFYRCFGWEVITRYQKGWRLTVPATH